MALFRRLFVQQLLSLSIPLSRSNLGSIFLLLQSECILVVLLAGGVQNYLLRVARLGNIVILVVVTIATRC